MTLDIDALPDAPGLRIRDDSEGETVCLWTDTPATPSPASTDEFDVPVDVAVEVDVKTLHFPVIMDASFRRDGGLVGHASGGEGATRLREDTYEIDASPPGVKLIVRAEAAAPKAVSSEHTSIDFGDPHRVVVGVRSHHETPVGTVTTTDDPRDLMAAVSAFGSALKTLSPDRSWPTLRGHPPTVEFGDELAVPDEVAVPETGVTIEVPPEYGAIYTVAPLAYYLGATVEPGEVPRLVAADSEYRFDASTLASDVRDVLEHVFTLDTVVREAGFYSFRTEQSSAVEASVDLDYEALFELPLAERTAAYLDVPQAATDGAHDWHYTADVAPHRENVVALPYLLDELALVRSPAAQADAAALTPSPDGLSEAGNGTVARSTAVREDSLSVALPEEADTLGQSWVTPDLAAGAANPTVGSYRRAFDWPSGKDSLDVHVVYNDARLGVSEDTGYDTHEAGETNVQISRGLSTSELREALHEETDFLHFIGHVTHDGMVCLDGVLDVRTLAHTGVKGFFLNGCWSYEQGRALLTAGSVGGLVTVDDVVDETAGAAGRAVSLLLDNGFPLYAVLDALQLTEPSNDRYAILGSGALAFRQAAGGVPVLYEFDTADGRPGFDVLPALGRYYPYGENGQGRSLHRYTLSLGASLLRATSARSASSAPGCRTSSTCLRFLWSSTATSGPRRLSPSPTSHDARATRQNHLPLETM